jgi:2-hydroxychromene-2-carboxylate isomerase
MKRACCPYVDAMYRAIWVDGKDMNDPAVVGAVLQQGRVRSHGAAGHGQ